VCNENESDIFFDDSRGRRPVCAVPQSYITNDELATDPDRTSARFPSAATEAD
jgi:hypothetical protein